MGHYIKVLLPHEPGIKIEGVSVSESYILVNKRINGQQKGIFYKVKRDANNLFSGFASQG